MAQVSVLRGIGMNGATNHAAIRTMLTGNVEGEGSDSIDALIAANAKGWTLDRMPTVDRNLLRIATYEITEVEDVPAAVAIAEAVELAKDLSTEDSAGFINGVLSAIA